MKIFKDYFNWSILHENSGGACSVGAGLLLCSYSFYLLGFYFYFPYSYFSYFSANNFCSGGYFSLCMFIPINNQNFKPIRPSVLKI